MQPPSHPLCLFLLLLLMILLGLHLLDPRLDGALPPLRLILSLLSLWLQFLLLFTP